jgi:hypothetical protein
VGHSSTAAWKDFDPAHPDLAGLRELAGKTDEKTFEGNYLIHNYHGLYWHLTDSSDFKVDPHWTPRDASSMAGGGDDDPGLMVSTDPGNWDDTLAGTRRYAAEIQLHGQSGVDYVDTSRGFGHEIFVRSPSKAEMLGTYPIAERSDATRTTTATSCLRRPSS